MSSNACGAIVTTACLLLGFAVNVSAQDYEARAQAQAPDVMPIVRQYNEKMQAGMVFAAAGQLVDAQKAFVTAVDLRKGPPDAYCLLAETMRMRGKLEGATLNYRTAIERAELAKDVRWHSRALVGMAVTLERMGELGKARDAWAKAATFADLQPDSPINPNMARAHIQAIDKVLEREQVYITVRQRIADREHATQP